MKFVSSMLVSAAVMAMSSVSYAADYYTIQNAWQSQQKIHLEYDTVQSSPAKSGWWSADWEIERVNDREVRFKNRWKGTYLNIETGQLKASAIEPGWWSAIWQLEQQKHGDYKIRNKWKNNLFLNVENGRLEATPVQPNWLSAVWKIKDHNGKIYGSTEYHLPKPPSQSVTAYQHCNYGGYAITLPLGRWDIGQLQRKGIRNDDLSSMRVPTGYYVTVYEHAGFKGKSKTFSGNDTCFVNDGFNDIISSIIVSKTPPAYGGNSNNGNNGTNLRACANSIQGRIPWDYKGSSQWQDSNIDALCGNETSAGPAICFDEAMHSHINWGGGTQWDWRNAIRLCEGTSQGTKRVQCFSKEVNSGQHWSDAIDYCAATID